MQSFLSSGAVISLSNHDSYSAPPFFQWTKQLLFSSPSISMEMFFLFFLSPFPALYILFYLPFSTPVPPCNGNSDVFCAFPSYMLSFSRVLLRVTPVSLHKFYPSQPAIFPFFLVLSSYRQNHRAPIRVLPERTTPTRFFFPVPFELLFHMNPLLFFSSKSSDVQVPDALQPSYTPGLSFVGTRFVFSSSETAHVKGYFLSSPPQV